MSHGSGTLQHMMVRTKSCGRTAGFASQQSQGHLQVKKRLDPRVFTATKRKAWQVYTSLGVNCQMIAFLSPLEQIYLQRANRFFYLRAVSRVQYRVQVSGHFFFHSQDQLVTYNAITGKVEMVKQSRALH